MKRKPAEKWRPDFFWQNAHVVVEITADRPRPRAVTIAGQRILRYTVAEVRERMADVVAEVKREVEAARASTAGRETSS